MITGIDVSGHNKHTNWDQVAEQGVEFAFIKASQGLRYQNSWFNVDWIKSKQNNIMRGAYHFFDPAVNGLDQAKFFLEVADSMRADDLPPTLDLEVVKDTDSFDVDQIYAFIDYVTQQTKKYPIVYGSPYFLESLKFDVERTQKLPLWIAHYTKGSPRMAAPWTEWAFWQYSNQGVVQGVESPVDMCLYNGTLTGLKLFAGSFIE